MSASRSSSSRAASSAARRAGTTTRLFFILHAAPAAQWVALPALEPGHGWYRIIDTSLPSGEDFAVPDGAVRIDPPDCYIANPRSTVVLVGRAPLTPSPT